MFATFDSNDNYWINNHLYTSSRLCTHKFRLENIKAS